VHGVSHVIRVAVTAATLIDSSVALGMTSHILLMLFQVNVRC